MKSNEYYTKRIALYGIIIIVLGWVLVFGITEANAGIYNNSGTLSEDSISFPFFLADSLGNLVGIDSTVDSVMLLSESDVAFLFNLNCQSRAARASTNMPELPSFIPYFISNSTIATVPLLR